MIEFSVRKNDILGGRYWTHIEPQFLSIPHKGWKDSTHNQLHHHEYPQYIIFCPCCDTYIDLLNARSVCVSLTVSTRVLLYFTRFTAVVLKPHKYIINSLYNSLAIHQLWASIWLVHTILPQSNT